MSETESSGARGTFIIRILNQQNATWQGTVTSMGMKEERYFRSLLELIKLIDSALADDESTFSAGGDVTGSKATESAVLPFVKHGENG
jgi:hypothetical protein